MLKGLNRLKKILRVNYSLLTAEHEISLLEKAILFKMF